MVVYTASINSIHYLLFTEPNEDTYHTAALGELKVEKKQYVEVQGKSILAGRNSKLTYTVY